MPLSLAILGYILQQQQQQRTEQISNEQRGIADSEAKEEVLQNYFDRLSSLLVDKNLLTIAAKVHAGDGGDKDTQPIEQVAPEQKELLNAGVDVIRARTLSILRRLENDPEKKTSVIRFLLEAEVISKAQLDLSRADLNGADLREANLSGATLNGADLSGATLNGADLSRATLIRRPRRKSDFNKINLSEADLIGATVLSGANLSGANLSGVNLNTVDLDGANFDGADLNGANLTRLSFSRTNLSGANFDGADLSESNLDGPDLSGVDLTKARICNTNIDSMYGIANDRDCEIDPQTGDRI